MIRALTPDELAGLVDDGTDDGFGALTTEKGCLPLRSLAVDVRIDGLAAATVVRQQFVNVFADPLEATYVFPLPPRAAVMGFRMLVDGAEIRGRIDERARARQDYTTAVAEGRHAAIVEEERPDVFTLRVGNIPPRSTARVEFTLIAPVPIDSLEATYRFPLVVAPRYCPGEMLDGDQVGDGTASDTDLVPDASRISPPILLPGMKSPVRLGISVRVAPVGATNPGADAFGCSLPVDEVIDDAGGRTITVVPGQRLDRDFVLRWNVAAESTVVTSVQIEPDAARLAGLGTGAAVADAPGDGTFTVSVVPPATAAVAMMPRDVVFLLDRSGSMGGWQMTAARRAVARMVDSLSADDRVAVIAFDDTLEHGGGAAQLVAASDRNRWRLLEWLATVEARGGTKIGPAIEAGLAVCGSGRGRRPAGRSRGRHVVLVTDAQVGDEDHVLQTLAQSLGDTRLFVVGIDNAVNEGLISRLADASGGLVELVESEDRLDEVLERIQARIQTPIVSDLRVVGDGIEVIPESIVPGRIPDLVPGLPLVLRGRYRSTAPGATVSVEGKHASGERWRTSAAVSTGATPGLGSLWARGMLRRLEDLRATIQSADGFVGEDDDVATPVEHAAPIEARIVALSTSFGVLCRFTALVAIDDRRPDERLRRLEPRRIVQPVDALDHIVYCRATPWLGFGMDDSPTSMPPVCSPVPCASMPPDDAEFFALPERSPPDAFARERAHALRLLAKARPRSGRLADVSAWQVGKLLRGVLRLMRQLGARGGAVSVIKGLAAAHARLFATPTDPTHLAALLDAIAAFAGEDGLTVDRWWTCESSGRVP